MATSLEQSGADLAIGNEANAGGGEGSGAEPASPAPVQAAPVRDVLSKVALALLAPKARSKPLSAQTDGFVLSTIGRLVDAYRITGAASSEIVGADLRELLDEADRRAITKELSDVTYTDAEAIASIDNEVAPIEAEKAIDVQLETDSAEQSDLGEPFAGRVIEIAIANVIPDRDQPRLDVDDELADSIKAQGVLQPIVVRRNPTPNDAPFILVDGERRYRGALKAGLEVIPARVVQDVEDAGDRLLHQVVFNEGKRLAPMEEAKAWARIMGAKGWNIQQLASALGRAKSTVSDRLAMLNAPAAFQPLFEKGVLSPAAAPIVRGLAEVPERFLTKLAKELTEDDWHDFVETQTTVPLPEVTRALEGHALHAAGLRRIDHYGAAAKGYTGETVTIAGKRYATNAEQLEAVTTAYYRGGSSREPSAAQQRADEERRKREAAERKKHQAKQQRIRAAFAAVSAKLPGSIGGSANQADGWSQLLVSFVMKEVHQDTLRVLAGQLNLTGEKTREGGMGHYGEMITRHAAKLNAGGRVQLALQLLLAPDLNIPSYEMRGPERLQAAAKLLKLDLAKVKAPDPAKAEKKPAAKQAAKKGGRR